MIILTDKRDCCGCGACAQRCPKQCIALHEDAEGFLYPVVNVASCIGCGLCEKVCPVINQGQASEPLQICAAKNRDTAQRQFSSSGGLFIALAERVIAAGGVVFGVVFDERWEAHHVAASTWGELHPMMRSKYVQSRTEQTFREAENYLKAGREVLYAGTPCQIAGLRKFLRRVWPRLLTVDLICHGVPSPGVWRRYLSELVTDGSEVAGVSFREKRRCGYDWKSYGFVVWERRASVPSSVEVKCSQPFGANPFMRGFLSDIYLRPSCYACPAKNGTSGADLTIADYWGIGSVRPGFEDEDGVGLAIVHTERGRVAFSRCGFEVCLTTLEEAVRSNPAYVRSVTAPSCRARFFNLLRKGVPVSRAVEACLRVPLWRRVVRRLRRAGRGFLTAVLRQAAVERVKRAVRRR